MKQRLLFLSLGVAITMVTSYRTAAAGPIRIMPLGDSITRGLINGGRVPGGYRTRLYSRLSDELYAVDFVGTADDNPDPDNLADPDH